MEKNEIYILYGRNIAEMARRLAEEAGLAALIGGRGRRVGLKPNLVLARPAEEGATTHPAVVEGLLQYLQAHGFQNLVILEGSSVGEGTGRAFERCGYRKLAEKYGVELVDTQKDAMRTCDCAGLDIDICESALALEFLINLPVLKGHCQTGLTCALKNNKGLISDDEKRRFHKLGLHEPIAKLAQRLPSDFILVDAICGDLDFEEGGNPVESGMLFAARDAVLCDCFAARQLGYLPQEVAYIDLAAALGVGKMGEPVVKELNSGKEAGVAFKKAPRKVRRLAPYIRAKSACSACQAALVRALSQLSERELTALPEAVCVGQDFRGCQGELGVGRCTNQFSNSVAGCPPCADNILSNWRENYF